MIEGIPADRLKWFQDTKGYKIIQKIGEGLQCVVYQMKFEGQLQSQKSYALKMTKPPKQTENSQKQNTEFERERGILKHQLQTLVYTNHLPSHPGIPRYKQGGTCRNFGFSVLQYFPNGNLMQFYKKYLSVKIQKIPSDIQKKCINYILLQILSILAAFKKYQIIHRDLKMQNIMLDQLYRVKVIDYSFTTFQPQQFVQQKTKQEKKKERQQLYKKLWSNEGLYHGNAYQLSFLLHDNSNIISGSKLYMSPQSLSPCKMQLPITHKTDIWSFGVIAYLLFFKRFPFGPYCHKTQTKLSSFQLSSQIRLKEPQYPSFERQQKMAENQYESEEEEDIKMIIQLLKGCLEKKYENRLNVQSILQLPYFKKYGLDVVQQKDGHLQINPQILYELYNPIYQYLHPQLFIIEDKWRSEQSIKVKIIAKNLMQNNQRIIKNRYANYYLQIKQYADGHHWLEFLKPQQFKKTKKMLSKPSLRIKTKFCYLHIDSDNRGSIRIQIFEHSRNTAENIQQIQLVILNEEILEQFRAAMKTFRN